MVNVKIEKPFSPPEDGPAGGEIAGSNSFSLAHLSDPHLTSLVGIKPSQLLSKRIQGYFSWLSKRRFIHRREIVDSLVDDLRIARPDHIVVTGDLTHLGLPMEYVEAREWLDTLGSPEQVTVIPGNHEAYWGKDWLEQCSVWEPYLKSDSALDGVVTAKFFPSLRIRGNIALIGLNSARPSLPFLATGSLGREQLSGLEDLLHWTGDRGLMRVVLIHHPPLSGMEKRRKHLTDSSSLTTVLQRCGAELVLYGHRHVASLNRLQTSAGIIPVIGVPSASALSSHFDHCAKYNLYQIEKTFSGWKVRMQVHGYSVAQQHFIQEQEVVLTIPSILNTDRKLGAGFSGSCSGDTKHQP